MANSVYDFTVKSADGSDFDLAALRGHPLLIVNTASACGFTPQYADLETLHREFRGRDFHVLGFPCNQFGAQEPGSARQIAEFCEKKYDVSFPVLAKVLVNGSQAEPLFNYLKESAPGFLGTSFIKWNFTKFLVDRDGLPVARHSPSTDPLSLRGEIERLLK